MLKTCSAIDEAVFVFEQRLLLLLWRRKRVAIGVVDGDFAIAAAIEAA